MMGAILNFWRKVHKYVIILSTPVLTLLGLYKAIKSDQGVASIIFALLLIAFSIYLIINKPFIAATKVGIIGISIMILGTFLFFYIKNLPSHRIIVAVANFSGPDSNKWAVTDFVLEKIGKALVDERKAKVLPLRQTITQQDGRETVMKLGRKHHATIVIWGWYAVNEQNCTLSVHFEIKGKVPGLLNYEPEYPISEINELQSYRLQINLSNELASLTLFTIGLICYSDKDYGGAERYFKKAINEASRTINPVNLSYIFLLHGNSLYHTRKYEEAISSYDYSIKLSEPYAASYFNQGNAYMHLKKYKQALTDYDMAIKITPKYDEAYNNRGFANHELKNYDLAIADYSIAIKLNQKDPYYYNNRGNAYFKLDYYDWAIADYNKAVELNQKFYAPYFNRGNCYLTQKKYEQAIADYSTSINLNPTYSDTYVYRGLANVERKDYARAIADYNIAIKLNSKDASYYDNRAIAFWYSGKHFRAIEDFKMAINLDPKYLPPYLNLAELYIITSQVSASEKVATTAIELASSPENSAIAYYLLGISFKLQGKDTDSIDAKLKELTSAPFEITWIFDDVETWLAQANVNSSVKTYVRQLIDNLKKYKK